MKYYVSVTETLNKVVSVDAENEKDALEKVQRAYDDSEIVLDPDCYAGEIIEIEEDQRLFADCEKWHGQIYQHID